MAEETTGRDEGRCGVADINTSDSQRPRAKATKSVQAQVTHGRPWTWICMGSRQTICPTEPSQQRSSNLGQSSAGSDIRWGFGFSLRPGCKAPSPSAPQKRCGNLPLLVDRRDNPVLSITFLFLFSSVFWIDLHQSVTQELVVARTQCASKQLTWSPAGCVSR